MRVLLTGCAGFIGWKVSDVLLREGHVTVGVDYLNNAYDVRLKEWRLHQLQAQPEFSFHRLDITRRKGRAELFRHAEVKTGHSFDAVINLAARAGVRQSIQDPWSYYETNLMGTLNLLEMCRAYQVDKVVLVSTSSLWGAQCPRPFCEDSNTERPLSPYAASKQAAEVLCSTYHSSYGINVTILRYFTVYGPVGRPDMSIFRFIKRIPEKEPMIVYGDGSQERDYTNIDDIAGGTVAALRLPGYEVINLGK